MALNSRVNKPIVVLGAGMTGLAAMACLAQKGIPTIVVDRRDGVGGMAAVGYRDAIRYHRGVHLLHPSTDELRPVVQELASLMKQDVRWIQPQSAIYFRGKRIPYPFTWLDLVHAFSSAELFRIAQSALAARIMKPRKRSYSSKRETEESFQSVVTRAYGDVLYRLFFRDYTRKVLGLDPDRISGEWAKIRVPMPSLVAFLRSFFGFLPGDKIEHGYFPENRAQITGIEGLNSLFNAMVNEAGDHATFHLTHEVEQVSVENGKVAGIVLRDPKGNNLEVACDSLISSIPLGEFVKKIHPNPPEEIMDAADGLKFRGLIFVFLLVRRERLFDDHWTYFQDGNIIFNRASEVSLMYPELYGPGKTLACFEITEDPGSAQWRMADEQIIMDTINSLRLLIPDLQDWEIELAFVDREANAYPSFFLDFQESRKKVLDWINRIEGLEPAGRQGMFQYLNLDQCYQSGRQAAEKVMGPSEAREARSEEA